jgi:type IV secretory pathway component VirB8
VIIVLGFVLAVLAGFGSVALVETLDATIHNEKAITSILGVAPLAVIPYLESQKENQARKNQRKIFILSCLLIILIVLIAFHFIIMPLDVFWFKLTRVLSTL